MATIQTNFAHLEKLDPQLLKLGLLAERYFPGDPNTSLLKLRQLGELLAQQAASRVGVYAAASESQLDLLHRLRDQGVLSREVADLFHELRRAGNAAMHGLSGDHRGALAALKIAWQLGIWYHRSFHAPAFRAGAFVPPQPPKDESAELRAELLRLRGELETYEAAHREAARELEATLHQLREAASEQAFWEQMAAEAESAKVALAKALEAQQQAALNRPRPEIEALKQAAFAAPVQLDEATTRQLIDQQLTAAGWTADTSRLRYAAGARPQKGKNLAIAEWPTATGPADYVLFAGLLPLAAVEAKRRNIDVSAALQQAKRYSRGFAAEAPAELHARNWGDSEQYRLPFVFSANGRPFLRQLATKSGIWFCDLRRPANLAHPLDGFFSPEGLGELLKRDLDAAHQELRQEAFDYGFELRDYQKRAIRAAEAGIEEGRREMLLAMATGTGKTKTCIALVYRLLKARRFRRVLFLVDRKALGEQAADAFKDTRMESLQTFADIFGIVEIDGRTPDSATAVHIATVQSLVRRVVDPPDFPPPPTVDAYDCIVVDECHRGYLLDRELSEDELAFRDFDDYVSKYRRVLDYFAAVKIGLTATPALHTTQIFGPPIFTYSYREAVVDQHLVDHEPPVQLITDLSRHGIHWEVGEKVAVYDPAHQQLRLFETPDEIRLEVDDFNRKVITRAFNQVVCRQLAAELDPASRQKTLIFCVSDSHCDLVVELLKEAFAETWGTVDDDAVMKITGAADHPLQLIRRFKNERNPNVAVTVDLLTTGIDVPAICNLVFLRRVNSRILFDQMLGRATRRCDEIGKEAFRIFDAVRIYEDLQQLTEMKPVVVDPALPFSQLIAELLGVESEHEKALVRDQLLVKLARKLRHLTPSAERDVELATGLVPRELLERMRAASLPELAALLAAAPALAEALDRKSDAPPPSIYVSEHPDRLLSAERGYGRGQKPEDYLEAFAAFVKSRRNEIPALLTVLTRPRDLTRAHLRELALELDRAGFSETSLATAWREKTNQEIAARIVGFIRQAAIGDPLLPYEQRVERALRKMLAARPWSKPQRDWLSKIAQQTKANGIVDRAALEDDDLIFAREGGGFERLNRLFAGELTEVLGNFNEALWQEAA